MIMLKQVFYSTLVMLILFGVQSHAADRRSEITMSCDFPSGRIVSIYADGDTTGRIDMDSDREDRNRELIGSFSTLWVTDKGGGNSQPMVLEHYTGWISKIKGIWVSQPGPGQHIYLLDLRSLKQSKIRIEDRSTGEIGTCFIFSDCC